MCRLANDCGYELAKINTAPALSLSKGGPEIPKPCFDRLSSGSENGPCACWEIAAGTPYAARHINPASIVTHSKLRLIKLKRAS